MNELEKKWEGFRASVYDDGAGNPTIGYGHKLTPGESFPGGIDQGTANQLLQSDVSRAQAAVRAQVKVPLTDSQFGALVDWVFNLGPGNLHSSTMLQKLNAGDYAGAAAEMLRWNKVNGQESAGLEARRADEVSMWNS
jgi:lysozyme